MNRMFSAIGRTVVTHRWKVILLWVAFLAFGIVYAPRLQEVFEREFVTGNTGDSQAAPWYPKQAPPPLHEKAGS